MLRTFRKRNGAGVPDENRFDIKEDEAAMFKSDVSEYRTGCGPG